MGERGCSWKRGIKGGKQDNCKSIINKIYFLKKEETFIQTSRRGGDGKPDGEDAGGPGKVVAGRLGGSTFVCR